MTVLAHDHGLARVPVLDTLDVRALLLKSSVTPTKATRFVSALVAGSAEISVAGYGRQTVTVGTPDVDTTNHWVKVTFDAVTFSGMSGANQEAGWLHLYEHDPADASALCLISYELPDPVDVGGANPSVVVTLAADGIRVAQKGVL